MPDAGFSGAFLAPRLTADRSNFIDALAGIDPFQTIYRFVEAILRKDSMHRRLGYLSLEPQNAALVRNDSADSAREN